MRWRGLRSGPDVLGARVLAVVAVACASAPRGTPALEPATGNTLELSRAAARAPSTGPAETFTGTVTVDRLFAAKPSTRAAGAAVTFEPGARSAWHSHPAGQTLIVTAGTGWVQEWGGEKQEIRAGDVVWTPRA